MFRKISTDKKSNLLHTSDNEAFLNQDDEVKSTAMTTTASNLLPTFRRQNKSDSFVKYEGGSKTDGGKTTSGADAVDSPEEEKVADDENVKEGDNGFTCVQGMKIVFKQSLPPILGYLFHPSYMMVNALILGRIEVPSHCSDPDFQVEASSFECMGP